MSATTGLVYDYVCKLSELPSGSKKCFALPASQRSVMLLNIQGEVFCMDQACYHHGGPLVNGDIEELGGKTTIKCPWHAYHIAIETGEGLYKGVDMTRTPSGKLQPSSPRLKSKGVKQRVHFVELRNKGQDIYVADSSKILGASTLASDSYAFQTTNIPEAASKGNVRIHSSFE
ncbi:hypothetical protein PHYSODRAFT_505338 [Plasmopara halstedii]|uniref:Rieske domain-containing protein n=1 Tax=Plasmopara halstedii TaxID=4781 RepID=A0A0P1B233_PLAHL|nr:hypothetical protein PHYSODRAFT_505338 [Plasmopara halstedii]CEG48815.1 hypothetical protein PHYSODRAFT_505338 [Plasmopara halstedii]|eukprot:XP_024585184.1 hypothetical protein PHYSODRAFT_505338 [Plasmopara halstedii]